MPSLHISFILGTRPEIIKLSPVIRECADRNVDFTIIHTGQHYSDNLDHVFFEQLDLPVPDYNLGVGSASHSAQTGQMLEQIEMALGQENPDVVLVQGDTNSVLAGALAACKMDGISVGHVEAGLRSFDRDMPEEINRRLTDHSSDHLFAPTTQSRDQLLNEGLDSERITVTGNTIVDAVQQHVAIAHEQTTVVDGIPKRERFGLLTAHRAENVDDPQRFRRLLAAVNEAAIEFDLQVIYPIHPRAQKSLSKFEIEVPSHIQTIEPQDFLDFLALEDEATIIFTDSGGVQEESCILQTPCVTLRENTERPETVSVGANEVVGIETEDVVAGVKRMLNRSRDWKNPFGDGRAAEQIIDTIEEHHGR